MFEDFWAEIRDEGIVSAYRRNLRRRLDQVLITEREICRGFRRGVAAGDATLTGFIRKRKSHVRPAINFAFHDGRAAVKIGD
jgi:hypothetical protein